MLIVYTHNLTPRVRYVFRQIFTQILGLEISFTTDKVSFLNSSSPKISYTHSPIKNELFFQSHSILFEKGVIEREINVTKFNDLVCFFLVNNSTFPFDIFGASFYMLSRYEEYLPHIKDEYGRFEAKESLAYKSGFLETPVVDQWAQILKIEILKKYPLVSFPNKKFRFINSIDVDSAFLYDEKGIVRTLGSTLKDIFILNFSNFLKRVKVILGFEKDPFDNFEYILNLSKKYNVETIFFYLLGDYDKLDKSVSFSNKKFQSIIKFTNDYHKVGIHPSFKSLSKSNLLLKEIKRLTSIIHKEVLYSRQHYLKLDVPNMYNSLLASSIKNDYSMGFASKPGFRSGTSNSYYFYDINSEIETNLRIHPFMIMDVTLKNYLKLNPRESLLLIKKIINEVKIVNGTFTSIWHNQSLYFDDEWSGWDLIYENMLKYTSSLANE
tara:strand:- start:28284 stop:29597 length:1314 start_codon:yes stop_codon:yes gene_type:complete